MKSLLLATLSLTCLLSGCEQSVQPATLTQAQLNNLADKLDLTVEVQSNINVSDCPDADNDQCYLAQFNLTFPDNVDTNNWTIYFSQTSPIQWDGSDQFDIQHINGDLHIIKPVSQSFVAGQTYTIPFKGPNWRTAESDFTPNYFVVADGLAPRVIQSTVEIKTEDRQLAHMPHVLPFTSEKQTQRGLKDNTPLATPEYLYDKHQQMNAAASLEQQIPRVIPKLQQADWQTQSVSLAEGLNISETNQQRFAAAMDLLEGQGVSLSDSGLAVELDQVASSELGEQGYQLAIEPEKIRISANNDAGLFYGLMSLAQMVNQPEQQLKVGKVTDVPRYDFRGLHLDISRNFHSKALILKLLNQMAIYKINKLHLHMADDEGWRLEIPGLPELTDIGAYRCFDLTEQHCLQPQLGSGSNKDTPVNGYLTTHDYVDILQYAHARQIEVIPAIDMPGHSRAAVKAMQARYNKFKQSEQTEQAEQYLLSDLNDKSQYSSIQHYNDNTLNPCIPSTYRFIEKVIDEVAKMHQQAGVPMRRYHIGADETAGAWNDSPACAKLIAENDELESTDQLTPYFIAQVAKMVTDKGLVAGAWSDGLAHVKQDKLPAKMQANIWDALFWQGHNRAHEFANRHWDTILSLPDMLYFDFPYQKDPQEPGYYWGSRYTDSFQVFEFMPENLPAHAEIWPDNMGNPYTATDSTPRDKGLSFTGMQAQFWSETIRADSAVEYMLFPRLIAFAERAWHQADWAVAYQPGQNYSTDSDTFSQQAKTQQLEDWAGFSHAMTRFALPELARNKVLFRLPTPGIKEVEGLLHANSYFPGLTIQYRQAGGEWQDYVKPLPAQASLQFRTALPELSYHSRHIGIK
ncbi:family 20 glycosylhydrolase [Neptunicella sp. SCSIO 80796]|uniref:family 20 glycosylhydrolase n=1 Tax=Neptunicella plasticusilytica TaxID=3117012 RepID=UPI003A4D590A